MAATRLETAYSRTGLKIVTGGFSAASKRKDRVNDLLLETRNLYEKFRGDTCLLALGLEELSSQRLTERQPGRAGEIEALKLEIAKARREYLQGFGESYREIDLVLMGKKE